MSGGHQIEMLTFETAFDSLDAERAGAPQLADFARDDAPRVIDAVFSEFCAPAEDIRLDRLDVALPPGPVTRDGLAEALRVALQNAVRHREPPPRAIPSTPTRSDALAELLHGLDHGWLPWPARLAHAATADASIARLLDNEGSQLVAGLLDLADPAAAVRRISQQWTAGNVDRFVARLRDTATTGNTPRDGRIGALLAAFLAEVSAEGGGRGTRSALHALRGTGANEVTPGSAGSAGDRTPARHGDRIARNRMLGDLFAAVVDGRPGTDPVARWVRRRLAGRPTRVADGDWQALVADLIATVAAIDRVPPDTAAARVVGEWPRAGREAIAQLLAEAMGSATADRPSSASADRIAVEPSSVPAAFDRATSLDRMMAHLVPALAPFPAAADVDTAARKAGAKKPGDGWKTSGRRGRAPDLESNADDRRAILPSPEAATPGFGLDTRRPVAAESSRAVRIVLPDFFRDPGAIAGAAAGIRHGGRLAGETARATMSPVADAITSRDEPPSGDARLPDDPAALAQRLRALDTPAWRRAFVAGLDRAGWRGLIALWVPAGEVDAVVALIDDDALDAARNGVGVPPGRRDWLLDLLLDGQRDRITLATVAAEWVAASGGDVVTATKRLAAMTVAPPALARIGAALSDLAVGLPAGPIDGDWLATLPPVLQPLTRVALAGALGDPNAARTRLTRLDNAQRAALVALASPFAGAATLAAADECAAVAAAAGLPPLDRVTRWQLLLDLLFGTSRRGGGRDDAGSIAASADDWRELTESYRTAMFTGWFDRPSNKGDHQRRAAVIAVVDQMYLEDQQGATDPAGGVLALPVDREADVPAPDRAIERADCDLAPSNQSPRPGGAATGDAVRDAAGAAAAIARLLADGPTATGIAALLRWPETERRAVAVAAAPTTAATMLGLGDDIAASAARQGLIPDPAAHWRWIMTMFRRPTTPRPRLAWLALQLAATPGLPSTRSAGAPDAGGPPTIPAGRFTVAWVTGLPQPLPAVTAKAIAATLRPPAAAIARLADLSDEARRRLLLAVAPATAATALAVVDSLTAAALAADLPAAAVPATFGWRLVIDAVFAEPRVDPERVAAQWSKALARAAALLSPSPDGGRLQTALDDATGAVVSQRAADAFGGATMTAGSASAGKQPTDLVLPAAIPAAGAPARPFNPTVSDSAAGLRATGGTSLREPGKAADQAVDPRQASEPMRSRNPPASMPEPPRDGTAPTGGGQSDGSRPAAAEPGHDAYIAPGGADADVASGEPNVNDTGKPPTAAPATRNGLAGIDPATPHDAGRPPVVAERRPVVALPAGLRRTRRDALVAAGPSAFISLPAPRRRDLLKQLGHDGSMAVDAADGLGQLWQAAGLAAIDPADVARLMFDEAVIRGRAFDPVRFATRWLAVALARSPTEIYAEICARLDEVDLPLATRAVLDQAFADLGQAPALPSSAGAAADQALPADATIYVDNAGLVIVAAYVPQLFTRLGLARDGRFVDETAAARGIHLLQYIVDGAADALEPRLVLNKLLCGVALAVPVPRAIEATADEAAAIDGLLRAVIANWRIIGNTSVAGLRESFLQREGVLTADETSWRLRVAPRSFDMLLDQLPWNFATIRLPWMDRVLHVDWR